MKPNHNRYSPTGATRGLPLRVVDLRQRTVIAHHLVLHGYGMWLPNDPRGSGSDQIKKDNIAQLGPIHPGRKPLQPPRAQIKSFYRKAQPLLEFPVIWLDDAKRQATADAFAQIVAARGYTIWACAILKNHVHLVVRRHRDDAVKLWIAFAQASADALRKFPGLGPDHPIWSNRPYKVFLYTPQDVRRTIAYATNNPTKERLPRQTWSFVTEYDGWPNP